MKAVTLYLHIGHNIFIASPAWHILLQCQNVLEIGFTIEMKVCVQFAVLFDSLKKGKVF